MKVKRSLLAMLALGMILCGCVDTPNEEHVSDTTTTTAPDLDAHYAYTQEELFVERGENQIYGILYLPQDVQGPLPAVIYAHGYDVYEDIGDYTKDVLILHGDADTIVPLSSSKRAQDIYDHAGLLVLPSSGHDFYGDTQQEAIDAILGYLQDSYD